MRKPELIQQKLKDHLTPEETSRLFDLLTTINGERGIMDPVIAKACDELDDAIIQVIGHQKLRAD